MKKKTLQLVLLFSLLRSIPAGAADFTVTSLADTGAGSLRTAITLLNASPDAANSIRFMTGGTINPATALPAITRNVDFSAPGGAVTIQRSGMGNGTGLLTTSGSPSVSFSGPVTLVASGSQNVSAVRGGDNLWISGSLPYSLSSSTTSNGAYGTYSRLATTIGGDVSGSITANAGSFNAYGLRSGGGNMNITGDVSALIRVSAGTTAAYGVSASDNMTIGDDVSGDIGSTAGTGTAFGIHAYRNLGIGGDVSGTVSGAVLNGSEAYGIGAGIVTTGTNRNLTIGGDISGRVTASASGSGAYGIYAGRDIAIAGDLSGTVGATAGTFGAYALSAGNDLTVGGDLSGRIGAAAGTLDAYGLYSSYNMTLGALSGTVDADVLNGSGAYGIGAGMAATGTNRNLVIGGDVSGEVSATALNGSGAYAIYAGGDIFETGDVSGSIAAQAGVSDAAGLYAREGGIYGSSAADAADISGSVTASSAGASAGILAWGGMNLNITGEVSATGASAYALRSGRFSGTGGFVDNGAAPSDLVALSGDGALSGNVDLRGGSDFMTVRDRARLVDVPELSGGDGYDVLAFDAWVGTLGASVVNWESTGVLGGSSVGLGASKAMDGDLFIAAGSALLAPAAGGIYSIGGDLDNAGLLDLRNGGTGDRFTVGGDYTGSGMLGLDIASGSSDLLSIGGDVEGSTALLLRAEDSVASLRDGGPLLLVHADGSSDGNAFVLFSAEGYGPYAMELVMGAAPSGGYDWYLGIGGYLPEAVALQALMPFIGQPLSGTLPRFGERLSSAGYCRASHESGAFWSRAFGSRYRTEFSGDVASHVSGYSGGVQAGADLYAGKNGDVSSAAGLYAGAGSQQGDAPGADGGNDSALEGSFVHAGAYATIVVPESYYVEWILQAGFHDIALSYASGGRDDADTWSWLASMEAGLRIPLGGALSFEPKAQVIYRHIGGFSLSPVATGEVWVDTLQGIRALLGAGLTFSECGGFNGFFGMDLIGDFDTKNRVRYLDTDVALKSESEWCFLGLSAGIGRKSRTGGPDYYLRAGAMYGLETGSSFGYTLSGGLRVPI